MVYFGVHKFSTPADFLRALRLHMFVPCAQVCGLFDRIDKDGDGKVSPHFPSPRKVLLQ